MSATRRQSEAIDRHNAAVMGLVAERDLLLAQQGELVKALRISAERWADLAEIIREYGNFDNAGFCQASAERASALLTKLGKS